MERKWEDTDLRNEGLYEFRRTLCNYDTYWIDDLEIDNHVTAILEVSKKYGYQPLELTRQGLLGLCQIHSASKSINSLDFDELLIEGFRNWFAFYNKCIKQN